MNDLRAAAIEAVEKATADTQFAGSVKIKAAKFLRDATGGYLRDIIPAVEWAMTRPRLALTRADKERAVDEMAKRLEAISENRAYADAYPQNSKPGSVDYFARRQELLRAAILRIAMARTVD